MSGSNEVSQDKALVYALDHVDIYACAWGPDGIIGNKVGYNKARESLRKGTKYVSLPLYCILFFFFFIQFFNRYLLFLFYIKDCPIKR